MECEIPEFYECTERRARKEHRCCECTAPIVKGEKYLVASGKWDGDIRTHRQHLLCAEACMFIRDEINDDECICFGQLKKWWAGSRLFFINSDRRNLKWKAFRGMMARIKRRERNG